MNYRQIIDLHNNEPCKIMADRKWFPPVNYLFDRARELYPHFIHDCPYTVRSHNLSIHSIIFLFMLCQRFKVDNFSLYFLNDLNEEDKKWLFFPNGVYRIFLKLWDNTGDEAHITIWGETKFQHRSLTPPNMLWST